MKQIFPDLWQSEKGDHFGMRLKTYVYENSYGRFLMYYTNSLSETEEILQLGGLDFQMIGHHHELQNGFYQNLKDFEPLVFLHEKAKKHLNTTYNHFEFIPKSTSFMGIEIIDTPGHTNTNLCYYIKSETNKNYLFVADTIFLNHGKWNTLIMPNDGGNKQDLIDSLQLLRQYKVDVIFCVVGLGQNDFVEVNQKEWENIIVDVLMELGD
ncbi:MAG: hypothetical protein ACPGSD_04360 [Flavobacteriales bacterium]